MVRRCLVMDIERRELVRMMYRRLGRMQLGMLLVMRRLLLMLIHCTVTVAGACKVSHHSFFKLKPEPDAQETTYCRDGDCNAAALVGRQLCKVNEEWWTWTHFLFVEDTGEYTKDEDRWDICCCSVKLTAECICVVGGKNRGVDRCWRMYDRVLRSRLYPR